MVSGRFGVRTIKRDLPSNMREMGDLAELAYSRPSICQQYGSQSREEQLAHSKAHVSLV